MLPVAVSGIVLGGSLVLALNPLTWLSTLRGFGVNRASLTFAALQAGLMLALTTLVTQFNQIDGFHLIGLVPLVILLALVTVRSLGVLLNKEVFGGLAGDVVLAEFQYEGEVIHQIYDDSGTFLIYVLDDGSVRWQGTGSRGELAPAGSGFLAAAW